MNDTKTTSTTTTTETETTTVLVQQPAETTTAVEAEKKPKTTLCSGCKAEKLYTEFSATQLARRLNHKKSPNGNIGHCKTCVRNRDIERKYDLTAGQFNAMLKAQHGKCAIVFCGKKIDEKTAHVDHDHYTKKVRGLLCINCNTSIGGLGDRVDKVLAVALYLARSTPSLSKKMNDHFVADLKALTDWHAALGEPAVELASTAASATSPPSSPTSNGVNTKH